MRISVITTEGASVVALSGRLFSVEAVSVRRVCQDLQDQGQLRLILDFAEVETVNGFFLASLIGLMARLRQGGGRLALVAVNPDLRRSFQKTCLEQVFPMYSTQAQAIEGWE